MVWEWSVKKINEQTCEYSKPTWIGGHNFVSSEYSRPSQWYLCPRLYQGLKLGPTQPFAQLTNGRKANKIVCTLAPFPPDKVLPEV